MTPPPPYRLVHLPNGTPAVYAASYAEAMHPGAGPTEEAAVLYVGQLRLCERIQRHVGEYVIWDIGLGAAANALAALRLTRDLPCPLRLVSFDHTIAPLAFALKHTEALSYLRGYEAVAGRVLAEGTVEFADGVRRVRWQTVMEDFPSYVAGRAAASLPKPHAIFFDAFSPAKNPAMWTLSVFENLFRLLDPQQPCALTTYSRSTLVRVALLLGGFFVGRGRPSGAKEETTVAANQLDLLDHPLDAAWLRRVRRSGSAEPLREATYRQMPLTEESWARLQSHPQFSMPRP